MNEFLPSFVFAKDLGFVSWTPKGPEKNITEVSGQEILESVDFFGKPPQIVPDLNSLVPARFHHVEAQNIPSQYPYSIPRVVPVMAARNRGVDIDQIDFVLGGSTLHVLATQTIERESDGTTLLVQKYGSTIFIAKSKKYTVNYADVGFQFERLVTGRPMAERHDTTMHEHVHLMEIGGTFKVLFGADCDAIDENGEPVEIKAGHFSNFKLKGVLQMVSSGAKTLVHAQRRGPKRVVGILKRSLDQQIRAHAQEMAAAENNIIEGLAEIQDQVTHWELVGTPHLCFELDFTPCGVLMLKRRPPWVALLPDKGAMRSALGGLMYPKPQALFYLPFFPFFRYGSLTRPRRSVTIR